MCYYMPSPRPLERRLPISWWTSLVTRLQRRLSVDPEIYKQQFHYFLLYSGPKLVYGWAINILFLKLDNGHLLVYKRTTRSLRAATYRIYLVSAKLYRWQCLGVFRCTFFFVKVLPFEFHIHKQPFSFLRVSNAR